MISSIANAIFLTLLAVLLPAVTSLADDQDQDAELWPCSGYCFMGADTATNPWIPVISTGTTEQETRDNIDCGP